MSNQFLNPGMAPNKETFQVRLVTGETLRGEPNQDMIMDMLVKPANNTEVGKKIEETFNSLLVDLKKVFNSPE